MKTLYERELNATKYENVRDVAPPCNHHNIWNFLDRRSFNLQGCFRLLVHLASRDIKLDL